MAGWASVAMKSSPASNGLDWPDPHIRADRLHRVKLEVPINHGSPLTSILRSRPVSINWQFGLGVVLLLALVFLASWIAIAENS